MQKLYFAADRTWVGDCSQDATHEADTPDAKDARWIPGVPSILDTSVLTLSPFYPSGRLGVCVESKSSKPPVMEPNHPPFRSVVAWMHLDALREMATPVQAKNSHSENMERFRDLAAAIGITSGELARFDCLDVSRERCLAEIAHQRSWSEFTSHTRDTYPWQEGPEFEARAENAVAASKSLERVVRIALERYPDINETETTQSKTHSKRPRLG